MTRCRKHDPEFEDIPLNFDRVFCRNCGRRGLLSHGRSRSGKRKVIWLTRLPPVDTPRRDYSPSGGTDSRVRPTTLGVRA